MKRIAIAAIVLSLLSACAGVQLGPNTTTGAAIGAVGGAILNRNNPAAGALVGGALGGAVGSVADQQNANEQLRRQREWDAYCRRNWRQDRRCR